MSGDKIDDLGLAELEDVTTYMPGVHIAEAGTGTSLFIRGIGSGINFGFEQSVGMFIDNVYYGRGRNARFGFLDIERVEVLKGPQSTLFGKNTIAGAINITSAKPSDEFEAYIDLGYEFETEQKSVTAMISGPLSDSLRGRLVAKFSDDEGYVENTYRGEDGPTEESKMLRLALAWDASDNLSFNLKAETGSFDVGGRQDMIAFAADGAANLYRQMSDPNFRAGLDYTKSSADFEGSPQHDDTDAKVLQLTADWALGEANLRYIGAYTSYEYENILDVDYGPLVLLDRSRQEEHDQVSHELLFTSATGNFVEWMAGAYYQRNTLTSDKQTKVALSAIPLGGVLTGAFGLNPGDLDGLGFAEFDQKTETKSAFAQATFNFTDTFRATAGLRFSNDQKNMTKRAWTVPLNANSLASNEVITNVYTNVLRLSTPHEYPNAAVPGVRDKDHVTGGVNLQWDATDDMMIYVSAGNGYKAGGFDEDNARANDLTAEFEDETVVSFELGSKMTLWDGRARLNMAVFSSEFEDVQVSTFDGNCCFVVGNAAETESQGFEADWEVLLTEELRFVGAISLLDASYKDFKNGPCTYLQNVAQNEENARNGTNIQCFQDLSGAQLQFAPDWSGNLGIEYSTELGSAMELMAALNVNFVDDQFIATDHDAKLIQKGHEKWDLLVKLASIESTWSVSAAVRNIFDETTISWGNDVPLASLGFGDTYFVNIDKPRTIELRARYTF